MTVELVLVPAGPGRYKALLGSMAITRPTRQPLFDGARALLALGYEPTETVTARHAGSDTIAMRGVLGEAARWSVKERDRGGLRKERWQPFDGVSSFPVASETADDTVAVPIPLPPAEAA